MMIKTSFKYLIEGTPIDFFFSTFSKQQLLESFKKESSRLGVGESLKFEKDIEENAAYIEAIVKKIANETPHTIEYFSIPRYAWCDMEICALAKIQNNGTTFMFTNNKEFADFIIKNSGYDFVTTIIE